MMDKFEYTSRMKFARTFNKIVYVCALQLLAALAFLNRN